MPQSYSTGAGGGQDRQAGGRGAGGGGQGNGGNNGIDAQQRAQMNAAAQAQAAAKARITQAEAAAKVKRDTQAKIAKAEKAAKIATYQAKVKANNKQKADTKAAKVTKAKAPKSFFSKMFDFIDGKSEPAKAPIGAIWDNASPQERGQSPVMQTPKLGGQGMQDSGAYYPQGFGKQLEAPSSMLGWAAAAANPMAAMAKQAGKVLYNQSKYGMNEETANEYQRLLQDPANAGMSEAELVHKARQPQMDKQLSNAFIHDETGSTANEAQLNAMRPFIKDLNMSQSQWEKLPLGMKQALARGTNVSGMSGGGGGGGGMFTGAPAPQAPQQPTLGQIDTGDYVNPTGTPSWAPQPYGEVVNNWAPQWNSRWMPQQVGMLTKPRN